MSRGFHCVLSLRACSVILAIVNLFVSTITILSSSFLVFGDVLHPVIFLHEDFSWGDSEDLHDAVEGSPDAQDRQAAVIQRYRTLLTVTLVIEVFEIILASTHVLLMGALIFGAWTRKSAFIRPWLYVGGAYVCADVVFALIHTALGVKFAYTSSDVFHIPLVVYLMLVSWNLYLDCREVELRGAAAPPCPVSMAALIEDDADADDADVPYSALHP